MARTSTPAAATACALAFLAIVSVGVSTQRAFAQDAGGGDLEVVQLRPAIYVIAGGGANIVMEVGPVGVILVDSGSSQLSDRVLAAVRRVSTLPIRYIINTSMEADHVGGNDKVARAGLSILAGAGGEDDLFTNGGGASVLAHDAVLARMSASNVPFGLRPTKTFSGKMYSMYLNGEGIQVIHEPAAHSDGDSIVFLRRGDVIATGDIIDTTRFPVIDATKGGSIQGEIDALNHLMEMSIANLPAQWIHDRTFLVPGHGRVYDKIDLLEYRDMMTIIRDRVQDLVRQGKTLEQTKAANPTLGYRSRYGADSGDWTTDKFVEVIYRELSAKRK